MTIDGRTELEKAFELGVMTERMRRTRAIKKMGLWEDYNTKRDERLDKHNLYILETKQKCTK